jgi:hypothetical protein
VQEVLPLLKIAAGANKQLAQELAIQLKLDEDEEEWLGQR